MRGNDHESKSQIGLEPSYLKDMERGIDIYQKSKSDVAVIIWEKKSRNSRM
jgi:hypothetical protein